MLLQPAHMLTMPPKPPLIQVNRDQKASSPGNKHLAYFRPKRLFQLTFDNGIEIVAQHTTYRTAGTTKNSIHVNKSNHCAVTLIRYDLQVRATVEGEKSEKKNEATQSGDWYRVTGNVVNFSVLAKLSDSRSNDNSAH